MRAEIISVGSELLLGDIVNSNSQYIARRLASAGITVVRQTTVGDEPVAICDALAAACQAADLIVTTGGLGPTEHDMTKEMVGRFLGLPLELHEPSMQRIRDFFLAMGRQMPENNVKQGMFPRAAAILPNERGTAPGCICEKDGKKIVCLPGPPREMSHMFDQQVMPYLKKFQSAVIVTRVVKIAGIGESAMSEKIHDLLSRYTDNPAIAPYARESECQLCVTVRAANEEQARDMIEPLLVEIHNQLQENVYGSDDDTLEGVTARLLIERKWRLAIAESCTGGAIAARFVNFPGISKIFLYGSVCYSNEAKVRDLDVSLSTLEQFGAVSEQAAREMVSGVCRKTQADIGIAVTGIAGPDGGSAEKPVGLVWAALSLRGDMLTRKFQFAGERNAIRQRSVVYIIDWLRRELIKRNGCKF